MPPRSIEEYQVGWVCALPTEMAAARAMLDEEHGPMPAQDAQDHNNYVLGQVHNHNVVIACLLAGVDGNNAAAVVATNMLRTFTSLRFGLMVGIGGGIPNLDKGVDIRLGDVVVSQPDKIHGGVVQYDKGKSLEGGQFDRKGSLNKPPSLLLTALTSLQSRHEVYGSQISIYLTRMIEQHPNMEENGYTFPGAEQDCLYCANCKPTSNNSCDNCQGGKVRRKERRLTTPIVHYGIIASGNQVVKDAAVRDRLGKEFEAKCVEMEAAGLMDNFPCLVIRGVCDYADAYKNDVWHRYAATTAAAYAKEYLSIVPPQAVSQVVCALEVMSKSTKESPSDRIRRSIARN
jgi:nucleoside phosphorylase